MNNLKKNLINRNYQNFIQIRRKFFSSNPQQKEACPFVNESTKGSSCGSKIKYDSKLEHLGGVKPHVCYKRRPETFVGDLQEVLKLTPKNINAFFFSWSITCRVATGLLCLLML